MKRVIVAVWIGLMLVTGLSQADQREAVLLETGFDDANLAGWKTVGDLCVAPAFCAGTPEGKYWLAMSTNGTGDAMTLCGYASLGELQSVLRSPDLPLPFKPSRFRITFKVKFLTNENPTTDLGNDDLTVRLLTMAGPVVIASLDDSGASPGSRNLLVRGDTTFQESSCSSNWRFETRMLEVTYDRTFREPTRSLIARGPVAIEFTLTNKFDSDFDSAAVLDDVRVEAFR